MPNKGMAAAPVEIPATVTPSPPAPATRQTPAIPGAPGPSRPRDLQAGGETGPRDRAGSPVPPAAVLGRIVAEAESMGDYKRAVHDLTF
ncbi:MAG: hypothetical protein ACHQ2F_03280 [Desulfobaccales bacterium]